MPRGAERAARQPNRTEFSEQKEIPDSVKSRKEIFSNTSKSDKFYSKLQHFPFL